MALNFPDSPTLNQVYTDTTSGFSYQWDGVVWQSYTPSATKNILVLDDISGSFNSSTTIFNLTNSGTAVTPVNSQQLRVTLGGIVQEPGTDYIVAASTIIFTTAPDFGIDCSIISLGPAVASDAPSSGTIFARQEYNPTGTQTTFTVTNSYAVGYLEVYHNGVKLVDGTDFTATDGSTFDLTTPAQNGDVVEAIVYLQTSLYTLGAYANDLTILGNATVAGITTLGGTVKVGVGTTALIVEGDARITGILTVGSSSVTIDGTNNQITVGNLIITESGISGETSDVTARNISGSDATFTGNVDSVGLITARSGIDVSGGSIVVQSGDISVSGVVTATNYVSLSDENLKENIQTINNALEKVKGIRGVSFDWKKDNTSSMGVVAQEVQEVLPELVTNSDPKTVNYDGLIAVLIEAIKDLENRITILESHK